MIGAVRSRKPLKVSAAGADTEGDILNSSLNMHPQQDNPLGELITLPVLLLVALAAWVVSFISGKKAAHR